MKQILLITTAALLTCLSCQGQDRPGAGASPQKGFALVELFTSEGCSSCPPADELVNKLEKESEKNHQDVYILNFHVDYWNYLGWKDPYSSPAFSGRQNAYSFRSGGETYTPQMLVNGLSAFVGSNESKARSAIAAALKKPALSTIVLTMTRGKISYTVDTLYAGQSLYIGFTEKNLTSSITAGENKGKTLFHVNVVRSFSELGKNKSGSITIPSACLGTNDKYEAVAWLQDDKMGEIRAATTISW